MEVQYFPDLSLVLRIIALFQIHKGGQEFIASIVAYTIFLAGYCAKCFRQISFPTVNVFADIAWRADQSGVFQSVVESLGRSVLIFRCKDLGYQVQLVHAEIAW